MNDKELRIYLLIIVAFIGCLARASVLAAKIIILAGVAAPAEIFAYSITFLCTDIISDH